ncbi:hypothetical protein, partial [Bacteroides uniformis]|uniref:hypothetical protein n=1 Tax=Bacteroides uniformis TaxID=820 RepID=UPI001AA178E0
MDRIINLSRIVRKHDSIMFLLDRLTKVSNFISAKTTYSTSDVALVFIKDIVILHDVPKNIV